MGGEGGSGGEEEGGGWRGRRVRGRRRGWVEKKKRGERGSKRRWWAGGGERKKRDEVGGGGGVGSGRGGGTVGKGKTQLNSQWLRRGQTVGGGKESNDRFDLGDTLGILPLWSPSSSFRSGKKNQEERIRAVATQ